MQELIEAIRVAVADGATADTKAGGVRACRTIAAALEAEVGKPITLPGVPTANPLAGILSPQTLDLLIAHLRKVADERDKQRNAAIAAIPSSAHAPAAGQVEQPGHRFALVPPPRVGSRAPHPPPSPTRRPRSR